MPFHGPDHTDGDRNGRGFRKMLRPAQAPIRLSTSWTRRQYLGLEAGDIVASTARWGAKPFQRAACTLRGGHDDAEPA